MKKRRVTICLTADIDPTPEADLTAKRSALIRTADLSNSLDIPCTFFIVGNLAQEYKQEVPLLIEAGHEIGCHGLDHSEDDEYNRMGERQAWEAIDKATDLIQKVTRQSVLSFRGPRVKTSPITQGILEEKGYIADSSVCSQRLDLFSSNLINPGWLVAPRRPYHPHPKSAYRRGNRKITVVPVSAMLLPFISGSLYIFGLNFMKRFFRILLEESRSTGKPIVYIFHPSEFAPQKGSHAYHTSLKSIRSRGFYFRRRFKLRVDEETRFRLTEDLINFMRSFPDVEFMTIFDYVKRRIYV